MDNTPYKNRKARQLVTRFGDAAKDYANRTANPEDEAEITAEYKMAKKRLLNYIDSLISKQQPMNTQATPYQAEQFKTRSIGRTDD